MKVLIGMLMIITGIAFGMYVCVWLMFVGGIVQIVEAIKVTPVESLGIAIGALRIIGAGFVGTIAA